MSSFFYFKSKTSTDLTKSEWEFYLLVFSMLLAVDVSAKKNALFYKSHKSMNIKHIASSDLSSVLFYSRKVNIPHSSTARPLVKTSSHIFGTQTIKIDQTLV